MDNKDLTYFLNYILHNKNLTKAQIKRRNHLFVENFSFKDILNENDLRCHNPKGVIQFLRLFSIDDNLKWYTHKWDKPDIPFSIQDMIKNAKPNYDKLRKFCFGENNEGVPAQLFYHVWNFINPNGNEKVITDQFNNPLSTKWVDVKKWCDENPGRWPGEFITPEGVSFETTINRFKRTIEFRTDVDSTDKFGFQIKSLIRRSLNNSVKIEFSDSFNRIGREAKFYCNVNAIHKGISKLCDWVSSYKVKGDTLFVDLDSYDGYYVLNLFHRGSTMSGPEYKINGLSGDFKSIREILFSACDFEISGKFNDNYVRIIALDQTSLTKGGTITTPTTISPISQVPDGVFYKLKFYL